MADASYVTVTPTWKNPERFNVLYYHYHEHIDEYRVARVSPPTSKQKAEDLAAAWAKELKVIIR